MSESELREERRSIGMIFQHFNLLSSRTVYGNVALPLELAGMPKDKIREKVMPLIELVGLSEHVNKYPSQLSGGQKQRVGIARALSSDPKILLSDEATSALDPETTQATLQLLKKINKELGLTIVMITHEMDVVKQICNRVVVMNKGVVVEEGDVLEVFRDPKKRSYSGDARHGSCCPHNSGKHGRACEESSEHTGRKRTQESSHSFDVRRQLNDRTGPLPRLLQIRSGLQHPLRTGG